MERINKQGKIAIIEILILIIGIVAFAELISAGGFEQVYNEETGKYEQKYFDDSGNIIDKIKDVALLKTAIVKLKEGNIVATAVAAAVFYGTTRLVTGNKEKAQAVGEATGVYYGTRFLTKEIIGEKEKEGLLTNFITKHIPGGESIIAYSPYISIAIAAYYLYQWKDKKTKTFVFECNVWDAPSGGDKCEECNKNELLPCSEYQCRSLGQGCEMFEGKCVWMNKEDVSSPTIEPWIEALSPNLKYTEVTSTRAKIINNKKESGCIEPSRLFSFGITTNEPTKCRYDVVRKDEFDKMQYVFGDGTRNYNHIYMTAMPKLNISQIEGLSITNNGDYNVDLYVRCADAKGNYNKANFIFRFCIDQGPDTTVPLIIGTSLEDGAPVAYNQEEINFGIDVSDSSKVSCKWSKQDKTYEQMENEMSCDNEEGFKISHRCTTTLTGLENMKNNKFYFRCKDEVGNVNDESQEITLKGTQELVINYVGPNGTIKGSTDTVEIVLEAETSFGAEEGIATCYYSEKDEEDSYIEFAETKSYTHSQSIYRDTGHYKYYIKCRDAGGNSETKTVEFDVEIDKLAPIIVRAYNDGEKLIIITNEEAECVYDTRDCSYNFDEGIEEMATIDYKKHSTDWDTDSTYYIKCKDDSGNLPSPNKCSIVVKPSLF